jgi:hypothetical protein
MMLKRLLFTLLLFATAQFCRADTIAINHFKVMDNAYGKDQISIVATDSTDNTRPDVNGTFAFAVNGFEQQLTFNQGVAFYNPKLEKSIFLYIRHNNDTGTHSMLYYIYKHDDKLSPWHISWAWLVAIPLALVLLGYLFKRFIIIAAVIFIIFLYFSHHNGLNFSTFFQSIFDGLKNLF